MKRKMKPEEKKGEGKGVTRKTYRGKKCWKKKRERRRKRRGRI